MRQFVGTGTLLRVRYVITVKVVEVKVGPFCKKCQYFCLAVRLAQAA